MTIDNVVKEEILCTGSDNSMRLCNYSYLGTVNCVHKEPETGKCDYRRNYPKANVIIYFDKPLFYE